MRLASTILLLALCSCATILQGGPDAINISTKPPGATVYLDGAVVGETPCQLTIGRSSRGQVRLEEPGRQAVEFRLPTSVNGTVILNILWGYLAPIGVLVDVVGGNGSAWVSPGTIIMPRLDEDALTDEELKAMVKKKVS